MNMDESTRSEMHSDRDTGTDHFACGEASGGAQDLKPFADQLMQIAQQLRDGEFSKVPAHGQDRPPTHSQSVAPNPTEMEETTELRRSNAGRARDMYDSRRRRDAVFGNPMLFGEPAWDILLDLYIAFVDDKPVSVSSACIGSAAPPTTGLRWLGVLADDGLIVREQDPADQRRVLVRLTDRGIKAMDEYLAGTGTAQ